MRSLRHHPALCGPTVDSKHSIGGKERKGKVEKERTEQAFCYCPPACREVLAAARLLTLSDDYASEAVRRASGLAVQGQPLWKDPWLAELGLSSLGCHQVLAVVERRV